MFRHLCMRQRANENYDARRRPDMNTDSYHKLFTLTTYLSAVNNANQR